MEEKSILKGQVYPEPLDTKENSPWNLHRELHPHLLLWLACPPQATAHHSTHPVLSPSERPAGSSR